MPPTAVEIYEQFEVTLQRLQANASLDVSDRAFVLPAFVKPSNQRPVTWRQCCIIRFWHPEDIPSFVAKSRDLKERLQLKAFPLFPDALDWRAALEPVAHRTDADRPELLKKRGAGAAPTAAAIEGWEAYARRMREADCGAEHGGDSLTKLAQAMGCNLHWDNLSFWTFGTHSEFLRLQACPPDETIAAYLGGQAVFSRLWSEAGDGGGPQLNMHDVQALAALGHMGSWLASVNAIPPLDQYMRDIAKNERLPVEYVVHTRHS